MNRSIDWNIRFLAVLFILWKSDGRNVDYSLINLDFNRIVRTLFTLSWMNCSVSFGETESDELSESRTFVKNEVLKVREASTTRFHLAWGSHQVESVGMAVSMIHSITDQPLNRLKSSKQISLPRQIYSRNEEASDIETSRVSWGIRIILRNNRLSLCLSQPFHIGSIGIFGP